MNRPLHRPIALGWLRSFEAVARHLNFSAAAEELHLTQPAISRQIKGLEEDVGAALFARGTRHVALTAAGQQLLRAVAPSLQRLDATVRQIRMAQGRNQIQLTTFASFGSLWLMPRLPDFERLHPELDIRITATDALVPEGDPELDVALRHCLPERAPPGALRLFGEVLAPVIGRGLAQAVAAGQAPPLRVPADLSAHTLIEMDDSHAHSVDLSWPSWLAEKGLEHLAPRRWLSMNFTHQQVQLALAGQGVALARLPMIHEVLARGELVEPFGPAGRHWARTAYWLVPLAGMGARPRPEVRWFCDWVVAQAERTRCAIRDEPEADTLAHCD
ncbi:LysR family transcriptional regulator [Vitreoscilla filiformis]|uniref:LysR family transcriptional regulator n=1 Tax=Vitreoscilla filiformis TaxID=63 RepID=UPI000B7A4604|nr:LysR family transcriptional regulator [Vitreoscilla filiformis]